MKIISLLAFLFSFNCFAFNLINLDELSLDYRNYNLVNDHARNLLTYPDHPKEALNVNINTTLLNYMYFNSIVESVTTDSQYRAIGLQLFLGIRICKYLDLGMWHHSQHYLDGKFYTIPNFPEEDAVQVKIYLYKSQKQESLF